MTTYNEIKEEDRKRIKDLFADNEFNDFVYYKNNVLMPRMSAPTLEKIKNFELRESDIWIVTFPK